MIVCLCLKFFQRASLIYLFSGTSGSFQLLPFFNPILKCFNSGFIQSGP